MAAVRLAVAAADVSPAGICLLGAAAEHPATDLGWIVPGSRLPAGGGTTVARFAEKPSAPEALALQRRGALWNTFVMVGAGERFWELALAHLPRQAALFERYRAAVDGRDEQAALAAVYRAVEPADWSRHVLSRAQGLALVPLVGSGWCDWGTPERLMDSLAGTPALEELQRRLAAGPRRRERPATGASLSAS
jgi:mannose-1-phosphate guanylyltransferase